MSATDADTEQISDRRPARRPPWLNNSTSPDIKPFMWRGILAVYHAGDQPETLLECPEVAIFLISLSQCKDDSLEFLQRYKSRVQICLHLFKERAGGRTEQIYRA